MRRPARSNVGLPTSGRGRTDVRRAGLQRCCETRALCAEGAPARGAPRARTPPTPSLGDAVGAAQRRPRGQRPDDQRQRRRGGRCRPPPVVLSTAGSGEVPDREQRAREGLGALRQRDAEAAGAVGVGELLGHVADAVAGGQRRDGDGAEDAERVAAGVEEGRPGVAGDAGRDRVDGVAPAVAVVADALALLRAELGDAAAQLGVAVAEDRVAGGRAAAVHAGRAAPERDRRVDAADVGRIDLDQGEVVVGAGVGVGLALGLHGQPRVVDEGARLAAADVDRGADRQRPAGAAVGVGRRPGARAVGGLTEVDVRCVVEHEVGRALRTSREGLHAGMDRGAGRGRPAGRRRSRTGHDRAGEDCEREGLQKAVLHRRLYLLECWGAPWYPVTKGSDRTCGGHAHG